VVVLAGLDRSLVVDYRRCAFQVSGLRVVSVSNVGVAIPIPRSDAAGDSERRLKRLRALAWMLDRSIPLGRWRIGLDPIIGLLPGAGDWIGAVLSLYVVYESARLGAPARLLARMGGNILVDVLIGTIPLVGDLFDFAWQANSRNLALIENHYRAGLPRDRLKPRSMSKIWLMLTLVCVVVLVVVTALVFLVVKTLDSIVQ